MVLNWDYWISGTKSIIFVHFKWKFTAIMHPSLAASICFTFDKATFPVDLVTFFFYFFLKIHIHISLTVIVGGNFYFIQFILIYCFNLYFSSCPCENSTRKTWTIPRSEPATILWELSHMVIEVTEPFFFFFKSN